MYWLNIAVFCLLIAFVIANAFVEYANEAPRGAKCHWWRDPLSRYLNSDIDYTAWQRYAFLGLALAETLLIFARPSGLWWTLALAISAAALVLVTITGAFDAGSATTRKWVETMHKIAAGIAFTGALMAEAVYLWHTSAIWFPITAVATAIGFVCWAPSRTALEEKAFTAAIMAGLLVIAAPPL